MKRRQIDARIRALMAALPDMGRPAAEEFVRAYAVLRAFEQVAGQARHADDGATPWAQQALPKALRDK